MGETRFQLPEHSPARDHYVSKMRYGVLGPVEVVENGERHPLGGPKQRTVLALLVASAGRRVSTDQLIEGVYGEDQPPGARRSIQTSVSNLRGELGDVIHSDGAGYVLSADRSEIDALQFEDAFAAADVEGNAEEKAAILRNALALWRGHPYADADAYELLTTEARRLDELRLTAVERRIEADLSLGRHRELVAELDSLTAEFPLREDFRAQHMLALYRCGRQADALRAYERTRHHLSEELGLDPSPELRDLELRILEQDPTLALVDRPAIKQRVILVADEGEPDRLSQLEVDEREKAVSQQTQILEAAVAEEDGTIFANRGSAVYIAFEEIENAARAAEQAQRLLSEAGQAMRMALSVGDVEEGVAGHVSGPPVTRVAALVGGAHANQVLLTSEANEALARGGGPGWVIRSLGAHQIDSGDPQVVYQLVIDGLPAEFPPLRSDAPPSLPMYGQGLAGYELREEIGSGAFGVVHRGYQPSVGREVAIKVIQPELSSQVDFIRRFEIEAQLIARLEHPHIVPLHDYWREPGGAFLVMRWVSGGSLEQALSDGSHNQPQTNQLVTQLGLALSYAHRNNVAHRDIKASNVLLDDEGNVYLSDFGIARESTHSDAISQDIQDFGRLMARWLGSTDASNEEADFFELVTSGEFGTVDEVLEAWAAINGEGSRPDTSVGYTKTRNPYKGLRAFGELDSQDFHGRETETRAVLDALRRNRLVAVVGPSGIGKSSIVRAGVVPALRNGAIESSEGWLITDMIPGPYPFEELASALIRLAVEMPSDIEDDLRRDTRGLTRVAKRYLPAGSQVFLIIDQFEELFTLSKSVEEKNAFLELLAETVNDERSNVRVIVTLRADYFDHPLRFADIGEVLQRGTVPISAPSTEELHSIIGRPAQAVGVGFEPGLVDHIASQVKDEPGALPLLEFSLTELFDQRESDRLNRTNYEDSGGVLSALGRRAEGIYESLDQIGQEATRQVFLRLVKVSDSGRDTRRRVRLSELERLGYKDSTLRGALNAFGDHRLLTFDRDPVTRGPTIEVAHEALLTEWERLQLWMEEQREDLLLHGRLAAALADWEAADGNDTYLLTGGRLAQHEAWTADTDISLTSAETEFLKRSRDVEDLRQEKRRRTRRLVLSGFGIAAVVAVMLATAAFAARGDAEANRLATASVNVLSDDPELSLLLALASAQLRPELDFEQRRALHAAIDRNKAIGSIEHRFPTAWVTKASVSPDGTLVVVGGEQRAPIAVYRRTESGFEELWSPDEIPPEWKTNFTFTPDGDKVVVWAVWPGPIDWSIPPVPEDPSVEGLFVFDAASGELLNRPSTEHCTFTDYTVQWSFGPRSGDRGSPSPVADLVAGWCMNPAFFGQEGVSPFEADWFLIDPLTGEMELHEDDRGIWWVLPSEDGSVIQFDHAGGTEILDRSTGESFSIELDYAYAPWATLSPSGQFLLHGARLLDPFSGELVRTLDGGIDRLTGCQLDPIFAADDSLVVFGCEDSRVLVFSTRNGALLEVLSGHSGWAVPGAIDSSNELLVTGSADGFARLWHIGARAEVAGITIGDGYYADAGIDVHGNVGAALIYPSESGTLFDTFRSFMTRPGIAELVIFEVSSGEIVHRIPGVGGKVARFSPDGKSVVVQGSSVSGLSNLKVFSVDSGEVLYELPGLCTWSPGEDISHCDELVAADATDLAWSPDGRFVAMAGGISQRLLVWDTSTSDLEYVSERDGVDAFSAVTFSPDGSLLTVSSKTGMWIYGTSTWDLAAPFVAHQGRPSWVMQFSSDGTELITAQAHSGDIRIYDTTTWEERNMQGGSAQTRDMAISDDETMIALADRDGNIHILDFESGELLEHISLDNRDITNVEFIENDTRLLISGSTGPVEILTLDPDELLDIARTRIFRTFTAEECLVYKLDPCPTLAELIAG